MAKTKRGDRVAAPARPGQWEVRFGNNAAVSGWEDLCQQAPGPTADAYEAMREAPRATSSRQHQLKGTLATREVRGVLLEQWQIEVTGAARVWYCVDDVRKQIILVLASMKHPKQTE